MKLKYKYIAFDQYNNHVWILNHPRKELMEHVGVKHADKMYVDSKDSPTGCEHVGYVVGGHWFDVFKITPAFSK